MTYPTGAGPTTIAQVGRSTGQAVPGQPVDQAGDRTVVRFSSSASRPADA